MNKIFSLYVQIENKNNVFDIRKNLREKYDFLIFTPRVGWLSLDQELKNL